MNIFSSPVLLEALAAAYFPGQRTALQEAGLEGDTYRLLEVPGRGLITHWHFLDFLEPIARVGAAPARGVPYLPRVGGRPLTVDEWSRDAREDVMPSPLVDYSVFTGAPDFEALVKSRRSNAFADARRRRRRLQEAQGPLEFDFADARPEALEVCLRWKSAQYVASGLPDLFAPGQPHASFFRRLAESGLLRVASLRAGGRIVAAHLGAFEAGRFYYWIPAYDPELTFYSPGRLLLDDLLKEAPLRGATEFDFLIGGEDYKWHYATHVRPVSARGRVPLRLRARRRVGRALRSVRAGSALYDLARRLTRRLA